MRAIVYLRVSTDDQTESGAGIAAQIDACNAYADRHRLAVVGPFKDEGISGSTPPDKREGLVEALRQIAPGDILLVAKRDRLARSTFHVATIEVAVEKSKGRVVSAAGEGTDNDDPENILMRGIIDCFAQYERLLIRSRTRSAMAAKTRRGDRAGHVPFGFDPFDDGRRTKGGNPVGLKPNPSEQAVIAEIRSLAADGKPPLEIARELQRREVPTKRGAEWSNAAVRRILARPQTSTAG